MGIPKTVLSTRMTGSARETEGRIRALYQRHRRPAIALVVLAALAAALCGALVSCQTAPARVVLAMDTQRYDAWGNCIEIPLLTVEGGQLPPGAAEANQALAALKSLYQTILDAPMNQAGYNLCLFYPADTERYCNLVFYVEDTLSSGNDGHVYTWVYDREEDRLLTEEDAFTLAGLTREELFAAAAEALDGELAEHQVPEAPTSAQEPALEGFRVKADGGVEFYLACMSDDADPAVDFFDGWQHLLVYSGGEVTHYDCRASTTSHTLLIPAEELMEFDQPLWWQWGPAGDFPVEEIPAAVAEQAGAWLEDSGIYYTQPARLCRQVSFDDLTGLTFASGWEGTQAVESYRMVYINADATPNVDLFFARSGDAYTYLGAIPVDDTYVPADPSRLAALAPYNVQTMSYLRFEWGVLSDAPDFQTLLLENPTPITLRLPVLSWFYGQQGAGEAGTSVYYPGDLPLEPRDGDVRIDSLAYVGLSPLDETYGVVYEAARSLYREGAWSAYDPIWLVVELGRDGAFAQVLGETSPSDSVEMAVLEQGYHLFDGEVSLWRDGYPRPIGTGACGLIILDGEPEETILTGAEPIYNPGDTWRQLDWDGLSARIYCDADYTSPAGYWHYSVNQIDTTRTDLSTWRGIRVGSTRAEVRAAYGDQLYDTPYWGEQEDVDSLWYCGNPGGWGSAIVFYFEGDTVSRILCNNVND